MATAQQSAANATSADLSERCVHSTLKIQCKLCSPGNTTHPIAIDSDSEDEGGTHAGGGSAEGEGPLAQPSLSRPAVSTTTSEEEVVRLKSELQALKTENANQAKALQDKRTAIANKDMVCVANSKTIEVAKIKVADLEVQLHHAKNKSLKFEAKNADLEAKNADLDAKERQNALLGVQHKQLLAQMQQKAELVQKMDTDLTAQRENAGQREEFILKLKAEAKDFHTQKAAFEAFRQDGGRYLQEKEKSLQDADSRRELAKNRELVRLETAVKDKADDVIKAHTKNKDMEAESKKKDGKIKKLEQEVMIRSDEFKVLKGTPALVSEMKDQVRMRAFVFFYRQISFPFPHTVSLQNTPPYSHPTPKHPPGVLLTSIYTAKHPPTTLPDLDFYRKSHTLTCVGVCVADQETGG